jgi:TonB family protein
MRLLMMMGMLLLAEGMLLTHASAIEHSEKTQQVCKPPIAANSASHPLAFVPKKVQDKRFKNRYPKLTYTIAEDGSVNSVKVIEGTGSPEVDAGLVKSIQSWKYKPQPGCVLDTSTVVTIDIR